MNLATLDTLLAWKGPDNGRKCEDVDIAKGKKGKLYEAMVDEHGIAYFELPVLIQANRIRNELVIRQDDFERFKLDPTNKIFPEDELTGLKGQWRAALRTIAKKSGEDYRDRGEWAVYLQEIQPYIGQVISAIANTAFPEEFVEGAGVPIDYDDKYMEHCRIVSKLENDWTLREKWPVTFCQDDLDTWQDCIIDGQPRQYWLPRQRFKRRAGGIWIDMWMSEILGKDVQPNVKFLDRHAKWAEEYTKENPL